ncbi:hypothetical protein BACCIP111895_00673 [Neobacillus rhizosphaerae]|uniref:Transcriptional regulator n=1 Tax=Neobacillus rhizosphaerae TaxID=2880965 RepID=A0ABN8KKA8_9BACI|nr:competence protein ComK [Neobacillus rhizosphaerae]CAH2713537.1 hypothetical protein BACCIP111895_00673 [Neobacillus rhizosphaerae]
MKQKQIEDYEVNSCTMFIQPVEYGSKTYSLIYEVEDEFLSPVKPLEIIKNSCDYFGANYESRKRGSRKIIGNKRKVPIMIESTNHLFFFPTISPNSKECIWISHEHVENYIRIGPHQTLITFQNKQSHHFQVPYSTIEHQMLKTSLLKTKILQRIEKNERKLFYFLNRTKLSHTSESSHKYDSDFYVKDK